MAQSTQNNSFLSPAARALLENQTAQPLGDDVAEAYSADRDLMNATLSPAAKALLDFAPQKEVIATTKKEKEGIPFEIGIPNEKEIVTKETSALGTLTEAGKFVLSKAGWVLRPLGAPQAGAIAAIGQKERLAQIEKEQGFFPAAFEALKVSGKAVVSELFPKDAIRPEFEKEALEATNLLEKIPKGLRPTVELATAILTDPAVIAFPFKKAIQKGLQTAAQTGETAGIFRNALEESVSFVPMSEQNIKVATKLAGKADKGNKKAAEKLLGIISSETKTQAQQRLKPIEARLKSFTGVSRKPIVEIIEDPQAAEKVLQPLEDIPEKAININFKRIDTTDDVKSLIAQTAKIFEKDIHIARRGKVSLEETAKLADDLGMTPQMLLARRKGQAFNAEEAVAARQILVSSGERLQEMAAKIRSKDATELDKFEFQKQVATHYAIQSQVSGLTAEAGRSLSAFRIEAKSTALQLKQIDELMRSLPEGMSPNELADMLAGIDTVSGINTFVREARKATGKDMLMEVWINGLLSGPQTHAVNITSNMLTSLYAIPERLFAAGLSKLTGQSATQAGEALQQTYGLVEGFKDGLKAGLKVLRTGEGGDVVSKLEMPFTRAITAENLKQTLIGKPFKKTLEQGGITARAVDLVGAFVTLPGRFLQSADTLFKSMGYRMELRAQSYRQAISEGLKGERIALRMNEIMRNPDELAPTIHAASIDTARYQTFTNELGETGRKFQSFIASKPALRLIAPFIRTPTNILKYAMERTPLAPLSKRIRGDVMAGGTRRDLALARMGLGSIVMGTVASYAASGLVTGGGPTNYKMKALLRNQGWQPYSLKIGDNYVSYGRLEPIGMMFGLAADATEILGQLDELESDDLATAIVSAITKNVTSKTWLRGVTEVIKAFDDPDRASLRYLQNLAGTLVPTGVAQIERLVDPELRNVRTILDGIRQRIPGYSDSLPPRRNFWGEPIVMPAGFGPDILSPFYISKGKNSPIDKELFRQKNPLSMPRKVQNLQGVEVELTPQEYDNLLLNVNSFKPEGTKELKPFLDNAVQTRWFQDFSDDTKEVYVNRIISGAKQYAKAKLVEESVLLQQIIAAKRQQQIEEQR